MSNTPEQIPPPPPPSQDQSDNPYAGRDHETGGVRTKSEVLAVAGLLGSVSGELGRIDKQNVGGDSQFIKAKKLDPREALTNIVGGPIPGQAPPVNSPSVSPPIQAPPAPNHPPRLVEDTDLNKRVSELEKIVEAYKKVVKFKRGISYTINTVNIKGELKNPSDILDIVSSELAKGTKTITLKLNDTTKDK